MASSETNPVEIVSAISERLSRRDPKRYMTPAVAKVRTDSGN